MINLSYQKHLKSILTEGKVIKPRNKETLELLGVQFKYPASYPVITIPERKVGYKSMLAEAFWILTGSNRLDEIKPWMNIEAYSNDNLFLDGAYGPPFCDQVPYVTYELRKDEHSRRAVISIWRPRPYNSLDIPCTLTLQFLIRGRMLHTIVSMRSSDAWLGIPYDCFTFAMMARYVAACLRDKYYLDSGDITINIGSAHIYSENHERCVEIAEKEIPCDLGPRIPFKFGLPRALEYWLKNHRDMNFDKHEKNDLQKLMEERYATKA